MSETEKSGGSRGLSLITGIFLMAVAGSVVMALKLAPPFISDGSQSALATVPVAGETSSTQVKDYIPPKTATDNRGQLYDVRYACFQHILADFSESRDKDLSSLEQTCTAGFKYKVTENASIIRVIPSPMDGTACHLIASKPDKQCSDGSPPESNCTPAGSTPPKCQVEYCVGFGTKDEKCKIAGDAVAGQGLDIAKKRTTALADILGSVDAQMRNTLMSEANIPLSQQNALNGAYDTQVETKSELDDFSTQRADIAEQIANYANCTTDSCARQAQLLENKDAALAVQQQVLQAQLQTLQGNAVSMLGGIAPSNPAAVSQGGSPTDGVPNGSGSAGSTFSSDPTAVSHLPGAGQQSPSQTASEARDAQTAPGFWSQVNQTLQGWSDAENRFLQNSLAFGQDTYCSYIGYGCPSDSAGGAAVAAESPQSSIDSSPSTNKYWADFYTYGSDYSRPSSGPSDVVAGGAPVTPVEHQALVPLPQPEISWNAFQLTPASTIPVTSAPIGPATPPEFQSMLGLPSNASIQKQLAALGTYDDRKALVTQYFTSELPNYRGTTAQNTRLTQLVLQYGAAPPMPRPRPSTPQ